MSAAVLAGQIAHYLHRQVCARPTLGINQKIYALAHPCIDLDAIMVLKGTLNAALGQQKNYTSHTWEHVSVKELPQEAAQVPCKLKMTCKYTFVLIPL